jgi:hypothetical protein
MILRLRVCIAGGFIMLYNEIFDQIKVLKGKRLVQAGFAADMLCLLFGDVELPKNDIVDWQEVGEYALHVQCMWRFSKEDQIVLTFWDLYNASLKDDKEATHKIFVPLNEKMPLEVIDITLDEIGTLQIKFNSCITFDVFPDMVGKVEHWRLINFKTDKHLVVFTEEYM